MVLGAVLLLAWCLRLGASKGWLVLLKRRHAVATVKLILGHQFFDLPDILLGAHREFQILLGDRVPVLVHHHDGQQGTYGVEEGAIDIVFDVVADDDRENVHEDLAKDEEAKAEQDVTQGPAVVERLEHKHDLGNDVDSEKDAIDDDVERPQRARALP